MSDHEFVHLHVHTEYSLLDGLSDVGRLVERAKALEMPALAITDHGAMFGAIDFYRSARKAGVQPIIGMEGYLAPRGMRDRDARLDKSPFHLLMLAMNNEGYRNLCRIATAAQLEGYYYKPRIDRDFLAAHSAGLVVTSGCLAAQIPSLVMEGRDESARELLDWYLQVFGRERFFIELQQHDIPELRQVNEWLVHTGRRDDLRFVATNDVHYILREDYDAHDTLLCIQTGANKAETSRMSMSDNSYYLADREEMWRNFGHINDGEALRNTLLVAEMCRDLNLDSKGYHLPVFPVPEGFSDAEYLRHLCEKGLVWRFAERAHSDPALRERLELELGTITRMGFVTYFLIVWDLCEFARHADIWWNVRGSGAGSLAAYCLGITNIDPIENHLLFERFLNPGRITMPDIDMDFPDDRRGEMIDYTVRKYGEDKVAAIITFGTLGAKAAVRDVGRAFGVELALVNQAAGMIPTEPKPRPIPEYIEDNPELKKLVSSDSTLQQVMQVASTLQGVSRHASVHAAGVIVADKPLVEYIPLSRQAKEDDTLSLKQVTQFPMETCESIGLLKIDFLGLSTLTIMRRASDLIARHHGIVYTMDNIPYRPTGDAGQDRMLREAFQLLSRGDTIGVFQVESPGMQQMLREMRPNRFENIVAAVALYRPGPMDYIPTYNARMHGLEPVHYHHPKLESILSETFGICLTGDTRVFDAVSGVPARLDAIGARQGEFWIQAVDEEYHPVMNRVTAWFDNGVQPVYRLTLRNGIEISATAEHRFLTEAGWKQLAELRPGDFVAAPPKLLEPLQPTVVSRDRLRVLAYLIADGSLGSGSVVDFVNKEAALLDEYVRCLGAFDDVTPICTAQVHGVTRVSVRHAHSGWAATSLLKWLRALGLKLAPGAKPGGCRSAEKFIPDAVFSLSDTDLAWFVASLWDCDGYVGRKLAHYKTISERLARDVQMLLLRLGIASTLHVTTYTSVRGERTAYQVTTYDTAILMERIGAHLLTAKRQVTVTGRHWPTLSRERFIAEMDTCARMSRREPVRLTNAGRIHLTPRQRERISGKAVGRVLETFPLPESTRHLRLDWQAVERIEPAGEAHVYDITVDRAHNFVANGLITHNCVYQEQIMQIASSLFGYSLGEADLMRRAVSKKKKEDLLKHKEKFLKDGPALDTTMTPEIAEKIFDDIEFFANYGFNKSHAADYAVITVQSAFLKAHYTAEYMAALLTVYFDDAEKVTTFLAECRRLGIPILPPSINRSALDFDIETTAAGVRGIRFGLAAIKNAGIGALQHVLHERAANGPFASLDALCRRVDLRTVGKRPLESLIKVGALDDFGTRPTLLNALDRIVSHSASLHKSREAGQVSLFGEAAESSEDLLRNLPEVAQARPREILEWEKELLGIYLSSHPIDPVLEAMVGANFASSTFIQNAGTDLQDQPVRTIGLVTGLRKMVTRNKDMMAIATLEDKFGSVNAVCFPRTWTRVQDILTEGSVVIVGGTLDMRRGDPQIVVESVTQEFTSVTADAAPVQAAPLRAIMDEEPPRPALVIPPAAAPGRAQAAPASAPPPELSVEYVSAASVEPPLWDDESFAAAPPAPTPAPAAASAPAPAEPARQAAPDDALFDDEDAPPPIVHRITLRFSRMGDDRKDAIRLRRLIGILRQRPGRDQFEIQIESPDQQEAYVVDFDDTTMWSETLEAELRGQASVEIVRVEVLPPTPVA